MASGSDCEEKVVGDEEEQEEKSSKGFKAWTHIISDKELGVSDAQTVQRLLNEYSQLEYEDIIAGQPTKFHYKQASLPPEFREYMSLEHCQF